MLEHSGWAHSAGSRTGHYLDEGDAVCGRDPGTLWGEMQLRPEAPAGACGECVGVVQSNGGSVPHRHRWKDATSHDGPGEVCRCGAKR